MESKIIIVNNNDKIINYKNRNNLDKNDIYRVSALWITNFSDEILLAKRHENKKNNPKKWGPAVSGTIEKGETYKSNILKESEEELGLKNIKLKKGLKTKTDNKHNHFTQWYLLKTNKKINEFKIQKNEVEKIKWFTKKELEQKLKTNPEKFLPNFEKYFKLF